MLDLGKKYKFKKVVPTVTQLSSSHTYQNPSGHTVPTKMFDFISLRGINRSFVKSICLIDAIAFEFLSRGLIGWFAMFVMMEFDVFY